MRAPWHFEVVIINPVNAGKQKNDKIDTQHLARYLHAGLLRSQSRISTPLEDLKAVFRFVAQVAVSRTVLKNRAKKPSTALGYARTI